MSAAPWVNGTVEAVAEHLREIRRSSTSDESGIIYASVTGMIRGLTEEGYPAFRSAEERMADIRTVLKALELVVE